MKRPYVITPRKGERFVYDVSGGRRDYVVDLLGADGGTSCTCDDWGFRKAKALAAGEPKGSKATLCPHGEAVRIYFLQELINHLAEGET